MIYFFGDSFTKGYGCLKGDPYYDLNSDIPKKLWVELISDELQQPYKNFGKSGAGSQWIYNKATYYLDILQPDDWVFLTDSMYIRQLGVVNNRIETVSVEYDFESMDRKNANIDNLTYNVIPYEPQWNAYYIKLFEKLVKYIQSKKVNTIYTNYLEFMFQPDKYMNIVTETNGKIDDNHFSWLGHKQYSQYLLDRINNSNLNNQIDNIKEI